MIHPLFTSYNIYVKYIRLTKHNSHNSLAIAITTLMLTNVQIGAVIFLIKFKALLFPFHGYDIAAAQAVQVTRSTLQMHANR